MDRTPSSNKRDNAHLDESFDRADARRARRSSAYSIPTPPTVDKQDRRRVNPEALASRLGPRIVAELDALIPAGSVEMPSFAARKDVQQRFGIDRRHIYDYYHAKGLRVVHGDRSNATPSVSRQDVDSMEDVDLPHSRRVTRSLPMRRACMRNPVDAPSSIQPQSLQATPPLRSTPLAPGAVYSLRPLQASPSISSLGYASKAVSRTMSLSSTGFQSIEPSPPASQSTCATSSVPATPPLLPVVPRVRQRSSSEVVDDYFSPLLDFPDDLSSPQSTKEPATPIVALHDRELSLIERDEHYQLVAAAIGSDIGSQELQGTYRAFMNLQTQEYFSPWDDYLDSLRDAMPVSVHPAHVPSVSADECGLFGHRKQPDTRKEDFKRWLAPVGYRSSDSRESSVNLSDNSYTSRPERRGIAEFIQSRRSLSSSSVSSDGNSSSISLAAVPPIMFGHITRPASVSSPAVALPPPPSPILAQPLPLRMADFSQVQPLASPDRELVNSYLFASSPRSVSSAPAAQLLSQDTQSQHYPSAHHGWYISPAAKPYAPMNLYPYHVPPTPLPPPVYAPHPEPVIHHPQPVPAAGLFMHGMQVPVERGLVYGQPLAFPPGHPSQQMSYGLPLGPAPPIQQAAVKPEWMDWEPSWPSNGLAR